MIRERKDTQMDKKEKAELFSGFLDDKNVSDITVIDVSEVYTESDLFIIGTALNERNARAVCDYVEEKAEENGFIKNGIEGYDEGKWILMDYSDVIVHIFIRSERTLFNLEKLWSSGQFLDMRSKIKEKNQQE